MPSQLIRVLPTPLLGVLLALPATAQGTEAPPVCVINGPYSAECNGQLSIVPITSAGSYDPDGTPIAVQWFTECPHGSFEDETEPDTNFRMSMGGLCTRSCVIVLRVFSGGQTTVCATTVTVTDTTPPTIKCPPDITVPATSPIDPGVTGTPTVGDACAAGPLVPAFFDTPGPALNQITRTWSVSDGCFTQQCDQIITRLGKSIADLDIKPTSCPNPLNTGSNGKLPVALVGGTLFDVTQVDATTLRLSRFDGVGGQVAPLRWGFRDVATPFEETTECGCHTLGADGITDLGMHFLTQSVVSALQLQGVPNFTYLKLKLTGQLFDGTSFEVTDCIRVQGN